MKGCCLLLSIISFLVMIQIQSGILQSTPEATTNPRNTMKTTITTVNSNTTTVNSNTTMNTTMTTTMTTTTTFENISTATSKTTCKPDVTVFLDTTIRARITTKRAKGSAPALSSLGRGSVLVFLTNTLIYVFHLS
ncbi:uncharacterized protein WM277_024740 [Molossus nigricans]